MPNRGRKRFLSTPSARRATPRPDALSEYACISIHALREEGDITLVKGIWNEENFYPRPPRGGRLIARKRHVFNVLFLSTPSARRATPNGPALYLDRIDFYPRPPRGGRPLPGIAAALLLSFLSTPSARRATHSPQAPRLQCPISIHALREEGDLQGVRVKVFHADFYPRPPRGGRRFSKA